MCLESTRLHQMKSYLKKNSGGACLQPPKGEKEGLNVFNFEKSCALKCESRILNVVSRIH